ncbi:MAG: right-handed parallel beta-helix repeat-containing protein, partial [Thermoplasmata archaeon]|nr:right-handed parallel beta-helix repeat-containing protein [Thermoplasmata archaeon]
MGIELKGLYIASDDAIISGTSIDGNLYGLILRGATISVIDSFITNSTYHGVDSKDSDVTLLNCTMADNGDDGARFMRGDAVVDECQVLNNGNGIYIRTGCNATIANTTVKGNSDGIFIEIDPIVEVVGCTIRGQSQDGISAEYWVDLTIRDSIVAGSTRYGLRAFNDVTVTSSGNTFRNNVFGAHLKMDCQMTSSGDIFTGNSNSGVFLESTSDLVIVDGFLYGNVAGIKADEASTVLAWATRMEDNTFEGYKLTDSDIELHDGTIVNCSAGGIVLAGSSDTSWTVHAGNSSLLSNSDVTLNGDVIVHGDLVLRDTVMTFLTAPLGSHSFICDGGEQDWQNSSIQTSYISQGIAFSLEGTATGKAWYFGIRSSGKIFSVEPSYARIQVPFEFHRSTFRDGDHGLEILSEDVVVDRCSFIDNLVG